MLVMVARRCMDAAADAATERRKATTPTWALLARIVTILTLPYRPSGLLARLRYANLYL